MTRTVNLTYSKTTLAWTDFEVVDDDEDIGDGEAEAGATYDFDWSSTGANITVNISLQHVARVKRSANKTATLLRHEQGHLDLGVLVVRRLKRDIEQGSDPNNANASHRARLTAINRTYDTNTDHSQNTANQNAWNTELDAALVAPTPPASVRGSLL